MARLRVIQPDADGDLDRYADWLAPLELDIVRPFAGDEVAGDADGILVLGGAMGANDEREHPWLADIKALLACAVERGTPVLGICLGAQLLAEALGGRVEVGAAGREAGLVTVRTTAAAASDALFAGLPEEFPTVAVHNDAVVRLPDGAVLLAAGAVYPHQAFRVGSAWGVQFHPEASPERIESWRDEVPVADRAAETARIRERDAEIAATARVLAARFVTLVEGD